MVTIPLKVKLVIIAAGVLLLHGTHAYAASWPVCDYWDDPDEVTEPFCLSNPPTPSCDDEFPSEHCLPCFNANMYWWSVKTVTPVCSYNNGSFYCPDFPGPPCSTQGRDITEVLTCPDYCGNKKFTFVIGSVSCEVCP